DRKALDLKFLRLLDGERPDQLCEALLHGTHIANPSDQLLEHCISLITLRLLLNHSEQRAE
ncbi:hypothetical protein, partial [Escherichia coli]|uniref:hypothetical protein n=1 Tax=Escherichia coli TaxID=562 RepID=UPI0028DE6F4B